MSLVANAGAVTTALLGCLALLAPDAVSRVLGVRPEGPLGIAEVRATYGGFFLALGIGCLFTQSVTAFGLVGMAWCGAAVVRALSTLDDQGEAWKHRAGVLFEAGVGAALLTACL